MRWHTSNKTALSALIVSLIALIPTIQSLWEDIRPKRVRPLEPYVYCLQRGLFHFQSDQLILKLEWENQRDKTVLIRTPYLRIVSMDGEKVYTYVADYSTIFNNRTPQENGYSPNSSLIVDPKSVLLGWMVFRIFEYDESKELFRFQFEQGKQYKVFIGYEVDGQFLEKDSQPLLVLNIPKEPLPEKKIQCYNLHPTVLREHIE